MKKRVLSLLLAVVLLVTALLPVLPAAEAAKVTKKRAIAIVFDNSGSMYYDQRWCRATYAMEVFAAMLNEEDTLYIYPMNPIKVDGKQYDMGYQYGPLVIQGPNGSEQIRRIITLHSYSSGTPVDTIAQAHAGLQQVQADEKYLIVLTDGATFHWYNGQTLAVNTDEFSNELAKFSEGVEQMFLAIDASDNDLPKIKDKEHQYIEAATSAEILPVLTDMCNRIFGRAKMEVSGKNIEFDVSLSKLIVFIQGKDITDVKLSGGTQTSQRQMRYSENGTDDKYEYTPKIDYELQGMLVTYENLDAGSYELTYTGDATSVAVYYEPDVDLQVQMVDANGNVVDPSKVLPGTYKMVYTMVDKYGNPTTSALLKDLKFDLTYSINGKEYTHSDNKSGSVDITLDVDDKLDAALQVTYLGDYTIRRTGSDLGWPAEGIKVLDWPVGQTTVTVTGGAERYLLSKLEQEAVYQVQVFCEGEQITGSDLDRVELKAELEGGNARTEIQKTEDGFTVSLKYNGSPTETQCGSQNLVITAVYSNRNGLPGDPAAKTVPLHIEDDSQALILDLSLEQDYYVIADLETSAPIMANLSIGGKPLTQEQFAATKVSVTIDGLQYDLQPDAANSRYVISLKGGENIATGDYTVACHVDGVNGFGKPAQADATAQIELQKYPLWLRILFWVLVALVILTLIWLFMNAKVLPKRIDIERCLFRVGKNEVAGDAECNFSGGGKKRGFLEINPPYFGGAPSASSCGITLELVAVSPRRTPSARRYIGIRGVVAGNEAHTERMKFGGTSLVKNDEGTFVRMGTVNDVNIEEDVDSGFTVAVYADVPGAKGRKTNVTLEARMQFY